MRREKTETDFLSRSFFFVLQFTGETIGSVYYISSDSNGSDFVTVDASGFIGIHLAAAITPNVISATAVSNNVPVTIGISSEHASEFTGDQKIYINGVLDKTTNVPDRGALNTLKTIGGFPGQGARVAIWHSALEWDGILTDELFAYAHENWAELFEQPMLLPVLAPVVHPGGANPSRLLLTGVG